MSSPTQRSLALLRRQGWTAQVVERFCSFSKRRVDLFGFVDIIACNGSRIIAVQATTASHQAARIDKIKAEPRALVWLDSQGDIYVHGWSKKGPRGKRKTWQCNEIPIFAEDVQPTVQP